MKTCLHLVPATLLASLAMLSPLPATAATGAPDSFDPNLNAVNVDVTTVQPGGLMLLAGSFTKSYSVSRNGVARFSSIGVLDDFSPFVTAGLLNCMGVQEDGKILVGGASPYFARFNADGTLDSAFNPAVGNHVTCMAVQADGRIVVGGLFTNVAGTARMFLARLNSTGSLDTGFAPPSPNAQVYCAALQADGKILFGGHFDRVGGILRDGIARLNTDGTLDTNFNPSATGDYVYCLAVQADGKIVVGGDFTSITGVARGRIARLNSNGTLDTNFNASADSDVNTIALQTDGKIVVGGSFSNMNAVAQLCVARLNANGTLDTNFNTVISRTPGSEEYDEVRTLALQADGKLLMGGQFTAVNGQTRANFARLQNDAATQSLTAPATNRVQWLRGGSSPEVQYVQFELSTNGGATYASLGYASRISGGWQLTGLSLPAIGKLRARARAAGGKYDGSSALLETTAILGTQPDISITGNGFEISDGETVPRLGAGTDFGMTGSTNGIVARTFDVTNTGNTNLTLGPLTIGGTGAADFTVTAQPAATLAPGASTGFQISFAPIAIGLRSATIAFTNNALGKNPFNFSIQGTGLNTFDSTFTPYASSNIYALVVQPDGKVLLGGDFFSINGLTRYHLARLNADGTSDFGFDPYYLDARVRCVAVQPDGKILVGGALQTVGGLPRKGLARVNLDGTLDASFNPNPDWFVYCIAVQADGRIVVGGDFTRIGGGTNNYVARLNADGTFDSGFKPILNGLPNSIAVQSDGKIVLGGGFDTVNGATRRSLARLNADGNLDNGFIPSFMNSSVTSVALQADGKILAGGDFVVAGGNPDTRNHIARYHADGTLDSTFDANANGSVNSIAVQANGKILLAGSFATMGGQTRRNIARVNLNGTLDPGFDPYASGQVRAIALQTDGRVVLGGDFTQFTLEGVNHIRLARMLNEPATQSLTVPSAGRIQWLRGGSSPESQLVSFELSTDGGSVYAPLGAATRISGGWELSGLSLPSGGHVRARAQTTGGYYNGSCGLVETVTMFGYVPEIAVFTGASTAPVDERTNNLGTNAFAATLTGSSSAAQTFTIKNIGTTNLTGLAITLIGANPGDFTLGTLGTNNLVPNATTTFTVTFRPVAGGVRNAVVAIASNDSNENSFEINVTGLGLGSEIAVTGNSVNIADGDPTPDAADGTDFGGVATAGSTVVRTFAITNIGNTNLSLGAVTVGGAHAADFTVTTPPTSPVATNGSTSFQVTFNPGANGLRSATLSFTNNDSNESPFNFSIQGTGIAPEIAVTGNNVNIADNDSTPSQGDHTDFGSVAAVSGSVVRTFTITNSGADTLALGSAVVSGPHSVDFTVTAQPATNVAPNGSTTFQITFDPTALGLRNAAIVSFSNNDADENPFNFNLQGTGLGSEIAVTGNSVNIADGDNLPSGTDSTDFGGVATANGSIVRSFIITNSGNTNLTLGPVTVGGTHAADFTVNVQPATNVAANGSTTIQVTCNPSTNGLRSAALSFINNDSDENPFNFSIQGTGTNTPPTVANFIPDQGATEDTAFSFTFAANTFADGDTGNVFTYTATNVPTWLTFTPATRNFSGTPSNANVAAVDITVTATDNGTPAMNVSDTFRLTVTNVNDAPTVANPIPDPGTMQGVPFSFTFAANTFADVDAANVFTYTATNVPAWVTFTPATRTFAGTPGDTNVGFVDIAVTARDNGTPTNASVSDIFRLTVTNVNDVPVFTKGPNRTNTFGTTTTQSVPAWATGISDGDSTATQVLTFNVSVISGGGIFTTPPAIASDGALTYTPNGTSGTASLNVSLTDDATAGGLALTSAVQTFTITVDAGAPAPPVINAGGLKALGNGAFQLSFTNSSGTAFSVLAATNVSQPASNWTVLGFATNLGGGLYQFTDSQATNYPIRFYRLRYP